MSPFGDANGGPLSDDQLDALVAYIRSWEANPPVEGLPAYPTPSGNGETPPVVSGSSGFSGQVLPIFEAKCLVCHNTTTAQGDWDASSYETVMSTGENAPVIIPGDPDNSLLAQYLLGTNGKLMPPLGALPDESIQAILDWIEAGAENN